MAEEKFKPARVVLYDSDCDICSRFKSAVEFLTARRRVSFVPLSKCYTVGVYLPKPKLWRSFHFIDQKGHLTSGADAIPNLIQEFPAMGAPLRYALRLSLSKKGVNFLYSTLSRLHETGHCKL